MRTRTAILAMIIACSAQPVLAEELGSTMSSSDAVYSVDTGSSVHLRATKGAATSQSLIVANQTDRTITIADLNGETVVIVKRGRTLDIGSAIDRLPEAVVIKGNDDVDGHYVRLSRGLVLTVLAKTEGV